MYTAHRMTANLMVADVNLTVEYYQQRLGFNVLMTVPETGQFDWAMVVKDNVTLMFQSQQSIKQEYPNLQNELGGSFILYCDVEHIDGLYAQLKDQADIVAELHDTFYGKKEFAIRDCNNYIITFAQMKQD